jgi:hypothetical protein
MCITCYKKLFWKPKFKKCKRCERERPVHAKELCGGCYNIVYHLEHTKDRNYQKYHNINPELYKKITEKCLICNFNKVVELHHLDKNRKNNSKENMIGLCPNHHRMIHLIKYNPEMNELIKKQQSKL